LIIQISDNGTGISSEQQLKIFDLYFTTKKDGNGLGLSISQKIISQHNGSISVISKNNEGTTFKIILPIQ
jgi:signal transduction histidine kinase